MRALLFCDLFLGIVRRVGKRRYFCNEIHCCRFLFIVYLKKDVVVKRCLVYDLLTLASKKFARKHLSDKFYLEGDQRKSLRNIIAREMLVNTLIHRELTSSFIAKFVIEKKKIYVENANRATKDGVITLENLEPNPKNPIIAAFFRNIGYADQLGSSVRNLYKYSRLYSGKDPEFKEGDVFRITVPLEEEYSFDYENRGQLVSEKKTLYSVEGIKNKSNADKTEKSAGKELSAFLEKKGLLLTSQQKRLLAYVVLAEEGITSGQAGEILGVKQRRAREILKELTEKDILCKKRFLQRCILYIE